MGFRCRGTTREHHTGGYTVLPPSVQLRGDDQWLTRWKGICRVVIGVQLVIAGFQLPAKYQMLRWVEMAICLLPVMTLMWLFTTVCILVTIPNLSLVSGSQTPPLSATWRPELIRP